ncbi:hypothetical protein M427DRAFT_50227 [Gonapodya prolifera JEL478]|uniref:Uncharacterized protein n=1 Tax=Gonapodya prolifera (strain JEL478) TaxID=1344416 RepID=A0A138ZWK8_GONPJ|nr:hypothetical protein M427DRAFT_50227 [Gonapodya prolifera JEL478]|eukprot:KXS08889.1 hypothetical protein M427DRAFT_50227 [Gonapodya prolifera JEL478]
MSDGTSSTISDRPSDVSMADDTQIVPNDDYSDDDDDRDGDTQMHIGCQIRQFTSYSKINSDLIETFAQTGDISSKYYSNIELEVMKNKCIFRSYALHSLLSDGIHTPGPFVLIQKTNFVFNNFLEFLKSIDMLETVKRISDPETNGVLYPNDLTLLEKHWNISINIFEFSRAWELIPFHISSHSETQSLNLLMERFWDNKALVVAHVAYIKDIQRAKAFYNSFEGFAFKALSRGPFPDHPDRGYNFIELGEEVDFMNDFSIYFVKNQNAHHTLVFRSNSPDIVDLVKNAIKLKPSSIKKFNSCTYISYGSRRLGIYNYSKLYGGSAPLLKSDSMFLVGKTLAEDFQIPVNYIGKPFFILANYLFWRDIENKDDFVMVDADKEKLFFLKVFLHPIPTKLEYKPVPNSFYRTEEWDSNSMYTYCLGEDMPAGPGHWITDSSVLDRIVKSLNAGDTSTCPFGFVECDFVPSNRIYNTYKLNVLFEQSWTNGCFFSEYLKSILKTGYKMKKIHKILVFDRRAGFVNFRQLIEDVRTNGSKTVAERIAKSISTQAYSSIIKRKELTSLPLSVVGSEGLLKAINSDGFGYFLHDKGAKYTAYGKQMNTMEYEGPCQLVAAMFGYTRKRILDFIMAVHDCGIDYYIKELHTDSVTFHTQVPLSSLSQLHNTFITIDGSKKPGLFKRA